MPRIATARLVLALLGIAVLLLNPAGACAGTPGAKSASHPCCPKATADKASCVCLDRQPAAPTLPPLADQLQLEIAAPPPLMAFFTITAAERTVDPVVSL